MSRLVSLKWWLEAAEKQAFSIAANHRLPEILELQTDPAWQQFIEEAFDLERHKADFREVKAYLRAAEMSDGNADEDALERAEAILRHFDNRRMYLSDMVARWDAAKGQLARKQRSDAGRTPKRRKWAEALAERISSWEEIPESFNPMEIETTERDFEIYRDGEYVFGIDADTREDLGKLKRTSFKKYYLAPIRRGQ